MVRLSVVGLIVILFLGIMLIAFFALIIAMLRDKKTRPVGFTLLGLTAMGGVFLFLFMGLFYAKARVETHESVMRAEAEAQRSMDEAHRIEQELRQSSSHDGPVAVTSSDDPLIPLDQASDEEGPIVEDGSEEATENSSQDSVSDRQAPDAEGDF